MNNRLYITQDFTKAYCHMNWGYETATVGIAIYDDRIVVENAGRFPARLSPKNFLVAENANRENTSLPPNPVIANVMYLDGFIEHWGRGLSMMARECERVGLPAPEFYTDGTVVRITFKRRNDTSKDTSKDTSSTSNETSNNVGNDASSELVTGAYPDSVLRLVESVGENWWTLYDLLKITGYKSRSTFSRTHLGPAIKIGLVILETPDSPNAPNQRYGLSIKGKALYYSIKNAGIIGKPDVQNRRYDVQSGVQSSTNDVQRDVQNGIDASQDLEKRIIEILKTEPTLRRDRLAEKLNISRKTAERRMKELGIAWIGHPKSGYWAFIREIR